MSAFAKHRWALGRCLQCGIEASHRRGILQCEFSHPTPDTPKRVKGELMETFRCLDACTNEDGIRRAEGVSPFGVTRFGQVLCPRDKCSG